MEIIRKVLLIVAVIFVLCVLISLIKHLFMAAVMLCIAAIVFKIIADKLQ